MSDDNQGTYKIPYKDDEFKRLNVQHMLWTTLLGGLFPAELTPMVEQKMASSEPRVLDAGCGTGIWSLEMAIRYPQAEFLGIDLVVPSIPGSVPSNLRLQQHDLSKGLPNEYMGQFDIVHCRTVVIHMEDPQKLVNGLVKCLKPGGLVIIPEGVPEVLDENRKPVTPFIYDPDIDVSENIMNARTSSAFGGYFAFLTKLIRSSTYQLPNALLKSTGAVENIQFQEFVGPVGWAGKDIPRGEEAGALFRSLLETLYATLSEMLITRGIPRAVVDAMKERTVGEFEERRYMLWTCASAIAST